MSDLYFKIIFHLTPHGAQLYTQGFWQEEEEEKIESDDSDDMEDDADYDPGNVQDSLDIFD